MTKIITGIDIITPISEIERMVLLESIKVANTLFPPIVNKVRDAIVSNLPIMFNNSAEYQSIVGGDLQHQFGLSASEATTKIQNIVGKMVSSTEVDFAPFRLRGKSIGGGLQINAIKSDFSDLFNMPEATQTTEKGVNLPWLEWLLVEGDKIIIYDYYFKPGNYNNSRSGNGIMVLGQSKFWRVPPQFAGTIDNNWITRTIDKYINDIESIVQTTMETYL